jgi:acyl-CoA synthetase (AMP-forming)/AMP-acid ligase II
MDGTIWRSLRARLNLLGPSRARLVLLFPYSGTTGLPKVAAHTHASATAFLGAFAAAPSVRADPVDVGGLVVPFTNLYGTAMLNHSLRSGATVVALTRIGFDLTGT